MIFLHENGITVVATNEAKRGKVYELNGEEYYVARGVADIKRIVDSGEHPLNRVITSKLTTLNGLFQIQGGYSRSAVPDGFNDDITNWDTSNVLSMEEVFSGWIEFNQDISNWDTSRVESMYGMFKSSKYQGSYYLGETSFNQDISKWNVSKVKNMSEMFLGATSFNQNISNWDVGSVENMDYMFSGAEAFNQPIGNWDTSKVESMRGMFSDVVAIGIVAFVGTLEYTRSGSTSFNQDISNWDVSNVENMGHMFSGAISFNQPIGNWDVSKVKNMDYMFGGDTQENTKTTFNQPIGNWNTGSVESMSGMFSGAKSFNQPIGNWDVSKVSSMSEMFRGAISFNQDLNGWHADIGPGVTGMFYGATSFNSPIGNWKVESISDMENMFREASAFNQDISGWDVSNVTQMKGLFQDATSFNQNIRNWKLNEKLPKSRTVFKDAKAFNIKEYNPFLNKEAKKRVVDTSTANLSSEDKKTIAKIKKLLIARDFDKIDLGLELLISLNNLELFETLLHDCKIGPNFSIITMPIEEYKETYPDGYQNLLDTPHLTHNKFFTGSGPAQPYLDYALINIIANAPQDAKIDNSLLLKNISSLTTDMLSLKEGFYSNFPRFLPLDKFSSLTSLMVDLSLFNLKHVESSHQSSETQDTLDIEDMFPKNIIDLNIKNAKGSLKFFKNLCQVKTLQFNDHSYTNSNLKDCESFKYLENLEELEFSSSSFKNLDFLAECKKIKKLDLSINYSTYSSNDIKLENIDFLNKLHELDELKISSLHDFMSLGGLSFSKKLKKLNLSVNTGVDVDFLLSCKQIKELSLSLSEDVNLKVLENCESLESLNVTGFSNLHLYGKISDIDGLKGLSNLKTISVDPSYNRGFKISGRGDGNLMTELNTPINKSSTHHKDKIRVAEEEVNKVRDIIHYKGLPLNGIIFYERGGILLYEYEVVNGIKDGIYREFYGRTHLEVKEEKISEKTKYEAKFQNDEIIEVIGFYNEDGINVLEGQNCVPNSILELKESRFYHDDNAFSGFCFLEVETTAPSIGIGMASSPFFNQSLFEVVYEKTKSKFNPLEFINKRWRTDKVSLILKFQNGIITKDILVATENKYTKTSVDDEYDLNRLSDDEQLAYKDLPKEKLYRLYIYCESHNGRARHPLSRLPVMVEGDNNTTIKTLDGKSIVVTGVFENNTRDELKKIIESSGGKFSSSVSKNTAFILSGSKMGPNKKLKAEELNIKIIGEEEFIEKYAFVSTNQTQTECESIPLQSLIGKNIKDRGDYVAKRDNRQKLSSDNKKTLSEIKKLLNSRDYDKIDEAVEKLVSLNNPELFEILLDSCEIHRSSEGDTKLIRNDFFEGSSPTQPYLNYAFFCLIANAPHEADIDNSLVQKNMSYLDMSLFFFYHSLLPLEKFSSLSSLRINPNIFKETNIRANENTNREDWLINNNIIELDLPEPSGTLKWFKNCRQLKSLKFKFGYHPVEFIESFEYLENLEELDLNQINYQQGFKNIDFLRKCKRIKKLRLNIASSYSNTVELENIDVIKNFNELEELEIHGINSKLNLDALISCKKIKKLTLSQKDSNNRINLQLLKNCKILETLNLSVTDSLNICGQILDIDGLKGLSNLKSISLDSINLSGLDNKIFIT